VIRQITQESRTVAAFRVTLGEVEIFEGSSVVYIEIAQGAQELRAYYNVLNHGALEYKENFPYHPHITLAQNIPVEDAPRLAEVARQRWADYRGPRSFIVSSLSFVQHVAPSIWTDVAEVHTGIEVAVGG
jgi:2'-5' RNA ligase